jgi:hypothetical protein
MRAASLGMWALREICMDDAKDGSVSLHMSWRISGGKR